MSWCPHPTGWTTFFSFRAILRKERCYSCPQSSFPFLLFSGESMSFPSPPSCESCELLLPDLSGASICRKILMALGSAFRTVSPLPTQSRSDSPSSCVFVVNTCSHLLSRLPTGLQSPAPEFIVDVESMDIFPVGWCEANSYPLTTPHKTACEYCPTRSLAGHLWDLGE